MSFRGIYSTPPIRFVRSSRSFVLGVVRGFPFQVFKSRPSLCLCSLGAMLGCESGWELTAAHGTESEIDHGSDHESGSASGIENGNESDHGTESVNESDRGSGHPRLGLHVGDARPGILVAARGAFWSQEYTADLIVEWEAHSPLGRIPGRRQYCRGPCRGLDRSGGRSAWTARPS